MRILIVEDQFIEAYDLQLILEKAGYIVTGIASSFNEALQCIEKDCPDLVCLDIFIKGEETGIDLAKKLKASGIGFVYISANSSKNILNEAKTKARNAIEESDARSKEIVTEMEDRLKSLVENYKAMEVLRDDLLTNFKHIAADALDRVERYRIMANEFDPDKHMAMAKREAKRVAFPNSTNMLEFEKSIRVEPSPAPVREREIVLEERTLMVETQSRKVQKSFFDEIG